LSDFFKLVLLVHSFIFKITFSFKLIVEIDANLGRYAGLIGS